MRLPVSTRRRDMHILDSMLPGALRLAVTGESVGLLAAG